MNCVIEGIIDVNELNEYKIIDFIDVSDDTNVYVDSNVNITINNDYTNYIHKLSESIEILSININTNEKNIKKISSNNLQIYIINFLTNINFKIINNNKVEDIEIKNIYSKSFIYKDIEKVDLDLYPINFEFKLINNKIHFTINFIIVDKSKDLELSNKSNIDEFINEDINKKNYSYIDINQEFI